MVKVNCGPDCSLFPLKSMSSFYRDDVSEKLQVRIDTPKRKHSLSHYPRSFPTTHSPVTNLNKDYLIALSPYFTKLPCSQKILCKICPTAHDESKKIDTPQKKSSISMDLLPRRLRVNSVQKNETHPQNDALWSLHINPKQYKNLSFGNGGGARFRLASPSRCRISQASHDEVYFRPIQYAVQQFSDAKQYYRASYHEQRSDARAEDGVLSLIQSPLERQPNKHSFLENYSNRLPKGPENESVSLDEKNAAEMPSRRFSSLSKLSRNKTNKTTRSSSRQNSIDSVGKICSQALNDSKAMQKAPKRPHRTKEKESSFLKEKSRGFRKTFQKDATKLERVGSSTTNGKDISDAQKIRRVLRVGSLTSCHERRAASVVCPRVQTRSYYLQRYPQPVANPAVDRTTFQDLVLIENERSYSWICMWHRDIKAQRGIMGAELFRRSEIEMKEKKSRTLLLEIIAMSLAKIPHQAAQRSSKRLQDNISLPCLAPSRAFSRGRIHPC